MSKFIKAAKQTKKPDDQMAGKPDDQKTTNPDSQQAVPETNPNPQLPDNQTTRQPDEKMVNLCVRVPESTRRHWAAEAKRAGITMTDVIVEALNQKFGQPDDQ